MKDKQNLSLRNHSYSIFKFHVMQQVKGFSQFFMIYSSCHIFPQIFYFQIDLDNFVHKAEICEQCFTLRSMNFLGFLYDCLDWRYCRYRNHFKILITHLMETHFAMGTIIITMIQIVSKIVYFC